ncbi:MAG: septum formation initiator family protein [bacterium]
MNKITSFRLAVFILVVFLLLAGLHLVIFAQNVGLKYELTDLKIKLTELTGKNKELSCFVAQAEDLGYIEKFAKERLGMHYPERVTYVP